MNKTVLDALIPREDFEISENIDKTSGASISSISIRDLRYDSFFYKVLRKPDFQRETNEWDAERVCSLIDCFVNGDLIPSVILWKSPKSYTFVIDGSHRLSALAAWINNDYGDGEISRLFYGDFISDGQKKNAIKVRKLINQKIGSYVDFENALHNPDGKDSSLVDKARNLARLAIQLQWVEGPADKAEASFFKINQQAVNISQTELRLIQSRKKPNGIAARAIIRSGKGHKYWSKFNEPNQSTIQDLSKSINKILFSPEPSSTIKNFNLPICGSINSSSALQITLDFVNLVNFTNVDVESANIKDDEDGALTIKFLKNCKKIALKINSDDSGSLGLHPAIYFYSEKGQYKIASFYGIVLFVKNVLSNKGRIEEFIKVRGRFEKFILKSDYYIQQISRQYRGALNAAIHISDFYDLVLSKLKNNRGIRKAFFKNTKYNYLISKSTEEDSDFTREIKSQAFIRDAIKTSLKCKICNGYLHSHSISIDHKVRKAAGGKGAINNAQLWPCKDFCVNGLSV